MLFRILAGLLGNRKPASKLSSSNDLDFWMGETPGTSRPHAQRPAATDHGAARANHGPSSSDWEDDWPPEGVPKPVRPYRAILVQRAMRAEGVAFDQGLSWLGGVPMLGNTPWPRTAKGVPHWHVASIDLQQLQSLQPQPDLPSHGHLAFFISLVNHGLRGAVVHVAEPGPCTIPADLPSMFDLRLVSTRRFPAVGEDNGLFPRWPVTLHLLPETSDWQEVKAAVHAIGGEGWQTYLTTEAFAADLPNGCEPWLWDSAQRFAASLPRSENDLKQRRILLEKSIAREVENLEQSIELFPKRKDMTQEQIEEKLAEYRARVAEQEALLETLLGRSGDYAEFVNRIQTWAGAHDRWASFSQDDLVALKNALEPVKYNPFNNDNGPLGIFYDAKGGTYYKTEDMANETLRAMASARSDVFCLLPDSVQTALAQSINQPSDRDWHQMFGTGTDIQGENMFHADKHMLLQLAYDPIIDFGFGDMGVVQFWMYADDMKHGNWAKATITSAAN